MQWNVIGIGAWCLNVLFGGGTFITFSLLVAKYDILP